MWIKMTNYFAMNVEKNSRPWKPWIPIWPITNTFWMAKKNFVEDAIRIFLKNSLLPIWKWCILMMKIFRLEICLIFFMLIFNKINFLIERHRAGRKCYIISSCYVEWNNFDKFDLHKDTPPRTPRISRLKSQIMKPTFLS